MIFSNLLLLQDLSLSHDSQGTNYLGFSRSLMIGEGLDDGCIGNYQLRANFRYLVDTEGRILGLDSSTIIKKQNKLSYKKS